jgi:radical SAM superfamily enzyme YgiQ (UPF0313 family)
MSGVDIVLVKPGSQRQLYGELSAFNLTGIEPPLWGALLAACFRAEGFSVVLYDAEVENWDYQTTAGRIAEDRPLLAAIVVSGTNPTASTMNMTGAREILLRLKERAPDIKTALTGLHPSALPDRTMREEPVDFVIEGEGIRTLPALLRILKSRESDYQIGGLWHRAGGRIVSNPRAPLVADLDALPMPAWDLLPMDRYRAHTWHCFDNLRARSPYGVISTSLGCPFRCSFCCINALFGKPGIRYRSPERVIEEIDLLVKRFGIRNIKIMDELFVLDKSRVARLCELLIARGYDLNMWAYARTDTVDREILSKMRSAGIRWVCYGFESANQRVLKGVHKQQHRIWQAVEMTYGADINMLANFMFGLPDDDYDTMQETLEMAKEINAEYANFYCVMAQPGSALYEEALRKGWPLPETWEGYSHLGYETLPLPTKTLIGPQVLEFRDRAFRDYFSSPRYLEKIRRRFGEEIETFIREMLARKPKRKHLPEGDYRGLSRKTPIVKMPPPDYNDCHNPDQQ